MVGRAGVKLSLRMGAAGPRDLESGDCILPSGSHGESRDGIVIGKKGCSRE